MSMNTESWLLNQKIKALNDQITSLKEDLEFEKICNKIDTILNKEQSQKWYKTCLQISRDYLNYVEAHPCADDDSYDDDDEDDDIININTFFDSPPISDDDIEKVKEVFRI